MQKLIFNIFIISILATDIYSQSEFQQFINRVNSIPDTSAKSAVVDSFMIYARLQGIPFIEGNTANYIYRDNISSCEVAGDFDEFSSYFDMTNLAGTNFFYYSDNYESNARLDYEFKINGSQIINDPENPDSILGYYGYHSELAMPGYVQPWEIEYDPNIQHGLVLETSIFSNNTGRNYQIKIYLPTNYNTTTDSFPAAYFQDGFSYIDWGNSINVLDNLIAYNKIDPIISIFVKPTNRSSEYAFGLRNEYRLFFVNELVPFIESNFRTIQSPSKRLVLGDSYGGNISALISYNHPDVFGNCGLQSAALHPNDFEVYNLLINGEVKNIKFSTIWGSYDNRDVYLTELKDSLISRGYQTDWMVLPEGHSWGLWRATVDTILQYFFPANIIPVELTLFKGIFENGVVNLHWITATEINNFGFEVERRDDNSSYKSIGFVTGNGTSTNRVTYNFVDLDIESKRYYYRLKQIDLDGTSEYSNEIKIDINDLNNFQLFQNYPNPFNPVTMISWYSPVAGHQTLKVYDVLGNEVATLVDEKRPAGIYEIEFNLVSSIKNPASGIYFYQLKAGELIQTRKMTLIK
ncbi:MAG: alpha/beta hydrolase-fold protein [Ignavibacterium sp.]|jgi:enterochelin esterase family protein|nr:alpha/beta hydrolase-fold protein [Ignavibacterium sp.]